MARHTDHEPSWRRTVVLTLVVSVLLVTGGLLAVKRSVDEHLPRFPPPKRTATGAPPAADLWGPGRGPRHASG
jgi:hypothetical protein